MNRTRVCVGFASLWALLSVLALLICILLPVAFRGWHVASVASGSMGPGISRGDVVLMSPPPHGTLAPGTVVTFRTGGRSVTHRIVSSRADGTYVTRGDANNVADSTPLKQEQITGVVRFVVPYIGLPREWLRERAVVPLALLLGVVVLGSAAAADVLTRPRRPAKVTR